MIEITWAAHLFWNIQCTISPQRKQNTHIIHKHNKEKHEANNITESPSLSVQPTLKWSEACFYFLMMQH